MSIKHARGPLGDDGYPTGDQLTAIDSWSDTLGELLEYVRELWSPYSFVQVFTSDHSNPEAVVTTYAFVTGGWSGNESLISALDNNALAHLMAWESSHRGGLHVWVASAPKLAMRLAVDDD